MKKDFDQFGRSMWQVLKKRYPDWAEESDEEAMEIAAKCGLCKRVEYDPKEHGDSIDAEPGDSIWWWGKS